MKLFISALSIGLFATFVIASERPNVLFIAVDDLKPLIGVYGENIPTPGIDRIAAKGTTFTHAYCQQAVCGPSRASVMTGKHPDTTQVWDLKTRMRDIDPNILTIPQHFKNNGYYTMGGGKIFDFRCVDKGFDVPSWSEPYTVESKLPFHPEFPKPKTYYRNETSQRLVQEGLANGLRGWNALNQYLFENNAWPTVECLDVPDDAYDDGAIANFACQSLDKLAKKDQPFFLAIGFKKPHLPFIAPKKYWDLFDRNEIKLAEFQQPAEGSPEYAIHNSGELRTYSGIPPTGPLDEATQRELIHGYMACVAYTDAQIARVLDQLEALDLDDNTIIVFWGDHGWHLGDHGLWCKHSNYEQATRVPFVIAAPGAVAGFETGMPAELTDLFPTLCDLAGLETPEAVEGKSLAPTVLNRDETIRTYAMSQYPRGDDKMGYTFRTNRYRLVQWVETDFYAGETEGTVVATELYDYIADPLETRNLANDTDYSSVLTLMQSIAEQAR